MTGVISSAPRALWYLTRGTGAVSLILLTASMVLGIAHSVRWSPRRTPRFVVGDLHRNVSMMVLVFIAIHVATSVMDGFAPIRWLDAIVPFVSAYRPVWLGLGAVAFDVLLAVAVTSLLRARMSYRVWRVIHWTAYGCWAIAVFHGVGIGSDTKQTWMLALVAGSVVTVVAAIGWRVAIGWSSWSPARLGLVTGALVMPVALAGWMLAGPLRSGWARAAGTPSALLTTSGGGAVAGGRGATLVLPSRSRFEGQAQFSGQQSEGGNLTLSVDAQAIEGPALSFHIDVQGVAAGGGGMSVRSGSVVLTPPGGAAAYRGAITGLSGGALTATLSDGHGDRIDVSIPMTIAPSGSVSGEASIQPVVAGALAGGD
jgi:hypothetical protein